MKFGDKQLSEVVRACDLRDNRGVIAQEQMVKALELPLRKGVFDGSVLFDIFEKVDAPENCSTMEYPLDFVGPGDECEYVAYTIPACGDLPYHSVEGDYIRIPVYQVGNSIETCTKYLRHAGWSVMERMSEALKAGFVKKMNNDAWHTLLAAGVDRNIIVADGEAEQGQFTKRLLNLLETVMRRNGGGNSTSTNRGKLTDLFMSVEAMMDIRCWNTDQIDEFTRREIYEAGGMLPRLYGVNLHVMDELGQGQEYQTYVENDLGVTLPTTGAHTDVEMVVGLDLSNRDSFIMPVGQELELFRDESLHRSRRFGMYGWMELGFAVLDARRVILGSF